MSIHRWVFTDFTMELEMELGKEPTIDLKRSFQIEWNRLQTEALSGRHSSGKELWRPGWAIWHHLFVKWGLSGDGCMRLSWEPRLSGKRWNSVLADEYLFHRDEQSESLFYGAVIGMDVFRIWRSIRRGRIRRIPKSNIGTGTRILVWDRWRWV